MEEIGCIKPRKIVSEMEGSYLDYAMSVIVQRALPDVRDGLKPVHRRVLYSLYDLGLTHTARFRKSATVVGHCLGRYHPHGDLPVYDSLVRLAQDFSMRYPLVWGQGNMGSIDGDAPAAMRYTETKMMALSEELLADIEKDTVGFQPNYDGTRKEPKVLPAKAPNLLLNGTMGIAVGMATNIPPHNLSEVVDGLIYLIDHSKATIEDLIRIIPGPDFPTGGAIFNREDILQAYATGKGPIVMRGRAEIIENKKGDFRIIITEIPYQVNKATLIERIAEGVKAKRLEGIRDIRDESDKEGLRVVVELKKDAYPKKVLNRLYDVTDLQYTFHVNLLALVDGVQPRVLTLKDILEEYLKHREEVVTRRSKFDLTKARERVHILEGLKKALNQIDAVIKTIKKSRTREIAHKSLMHKFKFTGKQAEAILEMKLQTLAGLERQKIDDELKEKKKLIKELEALLKSRKKLLGVIKDELKELKRRYGDERRTRIFRKAVDQFSQEDLIPNEPTVITVTRGGYIKRLAPTAYRSQSRGGKGVIGITTKEEDIVRHFFVTKTHNNLFFFTNTGRVFQLKAYDVPVSSRQAKGQALVNFLELKPDERVTAIHSLSPKQTSLRFLVMLTKNGIIKKTELSEFAKVRRSGLIAIKLKKNDELKWVELSSGDDEIILATRSGKAIHFKEKDVRAMGRTAAGVRAIHISKKDDEVVGMEVIPSKATPQKNLQVLVITENGYGKRSFLGLYKVQRRGGKGIKTAQVTAKTGQVVKMTVLNETQEKKEDLIIISVKGQVIRVPVKSVSVLGRATQGVRVMRLEQDDKVASMTLIHAKKD